MTIEQTNQITNHICGSRYDEINIKVAEFDGFMLRFRRKQNRTNTQINVFFFIFFFFFFFFEHNAQHKSYHWLQLASSCVCFILTHFFSCVSFPIGCRFAVEQTFLTKYANSVVYLLVRFFFKSDKNTPQRKKNALVYNERTQISQP